MCVIIIKHQENKKIDDNILRRSSTINPHGLGVVWLDTYEITYHDSKEWRLLQTDRPFIAHFRYATVGKICKENIHPFPCGHNPHEYLMQNGTIKGYGNKDVTDTQDLANHLCNMRRAKWKRHLAQFDCRFVTVNTEYKSYQIYNKNDWHKHDGVWYSKDNVLTQKVAVYGTLKRGHGNHRLLQFAPFLGGGKTKSKYPLVVSGLPYMYDNKGVGHNVEVEVYECDHHDMRDLDMLEGHPNFYRRKVIPIQMNNGEVIDAWVYFIHSRPFLKSDEKNLVDSYKGRGLDLSDTWDWYYDDDDELDAEAEDFNASFNSQVLDEWDDWNTLQAAKTDLQQRLFDTKRKLSDLKNELPSWNVNGGGLKFANDNVCPSCGVNCIVDEFEGLAYCSPCGEMYYADIDFSF